MIKKAVLFAVYLLFVLFVTAEIGLRIKGIYKSYSEKATGRYVSPYKVRTNRYNANKPNRDFNFKTPEFNYRYNINSFGFREREIGLEYPKIFVFGDSFTEGVGTAYDETWPRQMENRLTASGRHSDVYMCGSSGSDVFFNYINLKERFLIQEDNKPSHVIFTLNYSDLDEYVIRGGLERFAGQKGLQFRHGPWWQPIFRWSHLFRMYLLEAKDYEFNLMKFERAQHLRKEAPGKIIECLLMADQLCKEHDIRFLAVIHPMVGNECSWNGKDPLDMDEFDQFNVDFPLLNISEDMVIHMLDDDCTSYGWPIDGHFNSKGYKLLGDFIFDAIDDRQPEFWTGLTQDQAETPINKETNE